MSIELTLEELDALLQLVDLGRAELSRDETSAELSVIDKLWAARAPGNEH